MDEEDMLMFTQPISDETSHACLSRQTGFIGNAEMVILLRLNAPSS